MAPSSIGTKHRIGEVLAQLRLARNLGSTEVARALRTTSSTYLKIEREQRELSFLMALRVCQFYRLDVHEFISMLSDQELERQDFSLIRVQRQRERKKAEAAQAKVIDMKASTT